jgi:hypothetical protein
MELLVVLHVLNVKLCYTSAITSLRDTQKMGICQGETRILRIKTTGPGSYVYLLCLKIY